MKIELGNHEYMGIKFDFVLSRIDGDLTIEALRFGRIVYRDKIRYIQARIKERTIHPDTDTFARIFLSEEVQRYLLLE